MLKFHSVRVSRRVLFATIAVLLALGVSGVEGQQHPSQGLVGWSSVDYDALNFSGSGLMIWNVEAADVSRWHTEHATANQSTGRLRGRDDARGCRDCQPRLHRERDVLLLHRRQ